MTPKIKLDLSLTVEWCFSLCRKSFGRSTVRFYGLWTVDFGQQKVPWKLSYVRGRILPVRKLQILNLKKRDYT